MTDGTTAAGTVHIIMEGPMEDGTTHGIGEAAGDGTIHGTARITVLITADGMEDGIHIGDITTIITARDTSESVRTIIRTSGTVPDIRQARNACSEAAHHLEAA